eukprot:2479588-Amphidinium_carterae.2
MCRIEFVCQRCPVCTRIPCVGAAAHWNTRSFRVTAFIQADSLCGVDSCCMLPLPCHSAHVHTMWLHEACFTGTEHSTAP